MVNEDCGSVSITGRRGDRSEQCSSEFDGFAIDYFRRRGEARAVGLLEGTGCVVESG